MSDIIHQTTDIHHVHQTSDIRRLTSDIWHRTSGILHQTSGLRQQRPDIIHQRTESDIKHNTPDIRCLTSDIRHQTFDIRQQTPDNTSDNKIRHQTYIIHLTSDTRRLTLDILHQTSEIATSCGSVLTSPWYFFTNWIYFFLCLEIFEEAFSCIREHIAHWGYQQSRQEYVNVLKNADVAVSTAEHEFFGVSM